ncbi:MAG: thiol peroxidase [Calditrichia bacterium]
MSVNRSVTMRGNPLNLGGETVAVGSKAPDFTAIGLDLQPKKLSDFAGKTVILSAVPSLDTGVCDMETRRFNEIAGQLGEDVEILTISVDLPFAQKRWCGAAGVDKVTLLSDHRTVDFGNKYGMIIPELRMLARSIFVIDKNGVIQYNQLVPEIAQEPDYDDVIAATKKVM